MRLVTAVILALGALLSIAVTATASPYSDARGEVTRAVIALRDAELALTNMQKHIALLGASDAEAKESLDLQLAVIDEYMTVCHDRFSKTRRQLPAGEWTASKPGKSDEYWASIKEEEQFRVIGFALCKDIDGVTDIKGFHGRSKLESGPWTHPGQISPRMMKNLIAD
jgi:hypothetical protein